MKKIHENLKRFRVEKDMTQQEVADLMFVTRQCVSRWEQGSSVPDIYSLEKLATIYDKKINDLIDDDSMKALAIDYASKTNKRDRISRIGLVLGIFAVILTLSFGLFMIQRLISANQEPIIRTYLAQIKSYNAYDNLIILENESEQTINLQTNTHRIYDALDQKINIEDLKIDDHIIVSYQTVKNKQHIVKIQVLDSKVEKDLLGVFLSTNGIIYTSVDDLPIGNSFLSRDGFVYYMYDYHQGSERWETNVSWNEKSRERVHNEFMITEKINFNVYLDPSKIIHEIKYGKITSSGIEYLGTIDPSLTDIFEIVGEIGYDPHEQFGIQSIDVKYEIRVSHLTSFDELTIYEYDQNNFLINEETLDEFFDLIGFVPHSSALYGMIKVTFRLNHPFYPTYYMSHQLLLGQHIELPLSDVFGIVKKERFYFQ